MTTLTSNSSSIGDFSHWFDIACLCSRVSAEQLFINSLIAAYHPVKRKLSGAPPSGVTEVLRLGRILQYPANGVGQGSSIFLWHEQTGRAIGHHLRNAARLRGDDGFTEAHCFKHGEGKRFRQARQRDE